MAKDLMQVNINSDILKYDNRKTIELSQTLGRHLTRKEHEALKIKKTVKANDHAKTSNTPPLAK